MSRLLIMGDARSVHIERWCRYFEKEGFEVALFSLEPRTIASPDRFYQSHRRTGIGTIDYLLAKKDFLAALEDFRPDIVNAHFVVSYGWLATFCLHCPVVATAWGSDLLVLPKKSFVHRRRVARALKHAVYCTVDNRNLQEAAMQYMPTDQIIRVLMGVDREFFNATARDNFTSSGTLRIIAPRGLQAVYDPLTIISAAGLLRGKMDFHIDLLGNDPEAIAIREEIEAWSLSEIITVLPMKPHEKYIGALKEYDIYLSASRSDSTSVALLEAMTTGLLPVVSGIEGNREWIENGVNGLVFKPGSAESLAEAVEKAAEMRADLKSIAEANRLRIETEAIWQDSMDQIRKLFLELADNE